MTQSGALEENRQQLDRSALHGVAFSGISKWSSQLVAWASTFLVARLLTPADYGLLAMAGVFMGIITMLSEFGVGTSVITMRELSDEQIHQLNGFAILLGLGGTLLTFLAAYPLGLFFRTDKLAPVLMVVGLTFVITSIAAVPAALLRRELRFKTLALIEVVRGFTVPIVTLVGAILGLRYWALALGSVVGAVITTSLTLVYRREAFRRPELSRIASALRYGRDLLVTRVAWISYQDGDFAVAGRRLGADALGAYTLAWNIANTPIEKINTILSDVTPTLFSAVQNDLAALRRYFLNMTEVLCLVILPPSVGLALVSTDAVAVLLGPKWALAAGPLRIIALYAAGRSVTGLYGHAFNTLRETRFAMWASVALAVIIIPAFVVGSYWGPVGIATAWLVVHPPFSVIVFTRVRRLLELKTSEYLQATRLGVDGSVVMVLAVLGFQHFVAADWAAFPRLMAAILVGAVAFGASTWLLHRHRLLAIVNWVQRARRGESAAAA
jgi:PST family polysaccharide transporter